MSKGYVSNIFECLDRQLTKDSGILLNFQGKKAQLFGMVQNRSTPKDPIVQKFPYAHLMQFYP